VTGQGSTNLVYTILGFKPSLLSGFIIVGEVHIIWYQSFGSKASLTIFYFRFLFLFPVPCCEQKKEKKKKKKKRKESKKKKEKKRKGTRFQSENFFLSILFLTLFKFLTFLMSFGCFSFLNCCWIILN
jgi:hypothetical protein